MSAPLPPNTESPSRLRPAVWLTLLCIGYALLVWHCVGANAGGSDTSGYLNQAKVLASGHAQVAARPLPNLPAVDDLYFLYCPLGVRSTNDPERIAPTYPIGLPLLLAAAQPLFGWDQVANVVAVCHVLAGVLLLYAFLRALDFGVGWAALGAALLALSPLYLRIGTQNLSDVPALVWTLAAMLAAWQARRKTAWAAAAGFAFGFAVLVRPSNLVMILPFVLALGLSWRRWLAAGFAGLPLAVGQVLHSHAAYGNWLDTGYGEVGSLFALGHVGPTLLHYLRWFPVLFSPVALLAPALPLLACRNRALAAVLLAWIGSILGFYLFYSYTAESWWFLRFILPAVPALIVAGLWAGRSFLPVLAHHPRWRLALVALLLAHAGFWANRLDAFGSARAEANYTELAAWARTNLPPDAVIFSMQCSGCLFFYTDFTLLRWDRFPESARPTVRRAIRDTGRPLFAFVYYNEDPAALERVGGGWTKIAQFRYASVWRAADDGLAPGPGSGVSP